MKIKSRSALEQKASLIFQDLEKDYKLCEMVYVISELSKTVSFVMLQEATRTEED